MDAIVVTHSGNDKKILIRVENVVFVEEWSNSQTRIKVRSYNDTWDFYVKEGFLDVIGLIEEAEND